MRLSAADFARCPRSRNEAACRARASNFPRLIRFGLWRTWRRRGCRRFFGRSSRGLLGLRGFCPRGGGFLVVLLETAVFVFASRATTAWLVAARALNALSRHDEKCKRPCA